MPEDMKGKIAAELALLLLERRDADGITVKELAARCGISRQSFYYHFQDIFEVMEWRLEEAVREVTARSLAAETPQEALGAFAEATLQNRELVLKLMASKRRPQLERLLASGAKRWLAGLARLRAESLGMSVGEAALMLDFCAYGVAGLLLEYCERGPAEAAQLAPRMGRLLSGLLG